MNVSLFRWAGFKCLAPDDGPSAELEIGKDLGEHEAKLEKHEEAIEEVKQVAEAAAFNAEWVEARLRDGNNELWDKLNELATTVGSLLERLPKASEEAAEETIQDPPVNLDPPAESVAIISEAKPAPKPRRAWYL